MDELNLDMVGGDGAVPLLERLPVRPDDLDLFRLGRLMLLLRAYEVLDHPKPLDIERLGFYDFFAANPFLVLGGDDRARREVMLAGFDANSLSYQSSAQRFSNRRARLQYDLGLLVGRSLVGATAAGGRVVYGLTDRGRERADSFISLYARAYRRAAALIVGRLDKLSDRRLHEQARTWLNAEAFLIDLYDVEVD